MGLADLSAAGKLPEQTAKGTGEGSEGQNQGAVAGLSYDTMKMGDTGPKSWYDKLRESSEGFGCCF